MMMNSIKEMQERKKTLIKERDNIGKELAKIDDEERILAEKLFPFGVKEWKIFRIGGISSMLDTPSSISLQSGNRVGIFTPAEKIEIGFDFDMKTIRINNCLLWRSMLNYPWFSSKTAYFIFLEGELENVMELVKKHNLIIEGDIKRLNETMEKYHEYMSSIEDTFHKLTSKKQWFINLSL